MVMKAIDWENLKFGYMRTDYNVRCYYRDGKWGEIETCSEETINLSMAATCLHYGQEAFEGLKAYRCPDGKVRVFRMDENAARLQSTCRGIMMPEVPPPFSRRWSPRWCVSTRSISPPTRAALPSTSVRSLLVPAHRLAYILPANTSSSSS